MLALIRYIVILIYIISLHHLNYRNQLAKREEGDLDCPEPALLPGGCGIQRKSTIYGSKNNNNTHNILWWGNGANIRTQKKKYQFLETWIMESISSCRQLPMKHSENRYSTVEELESLGIFVWSRNRRRREFQTKELNLVICGLPVTLNHLCESCHRSHSVRNLDWRRIVIRTHQVIIVILCNDTFM